MKILAIDTSSAACSVALLHHKRDRGGKVTAAHRIAPKQHTSIILPMIQSLLNEARITLSQLDAVAFGCGPGSFTGIRIAASLAQGLAYANDLAVIPVSSLAAAAQAAFNQHGWKKLLVAVDARMDQVYWAGYEVAGGLVHPVFDEQLVSPHAITEIGSGEWYGIGDGWSLYDNLIRDRGQVEPAKIDTKVVATAEAVLDIASNKYDKGEWVAASEAIPVYLR